MLWFYLTVFMMASDHPSLWTLSGKQNGDWFGYSAHASSDHNGDQRPDLLVGAARHQPFGYVHLRSPDDDQVLLEWKGEDYLNQAGLFGWSVGVVDVDSDGTNEVLVGAPTADAERGMAFLFSAFDGSLIRSFTGAAPGDCLGWSVSGAGDVDADGCEDFILGAPGIGVGGDTEGYVLVISGRTGLEIYAPTGDSAFEFFGTCVSSAGELDGDLASEFFVGAPGDDLSGPASGSAYVFRGSDGTILHQFQGSAIGDQFGLFVNEAFDVDGDFVDDVIVGAPQLFNDGPGYVEVLNGGSGQLIHHVDGPEADAWFGRTVAGIKDIDGDLRGEFIVGSPHSSENGVDSGAIFVIDGLTGQVQETLVGSPGDLLGDSVGALPDMNGDGYVDYLGGSPEGYVNVYSSHCGELIEYGSGCAGSGGHVPTLAVTGCAAPLGKLRLMIQGGRGGAQTLLLQGADRGNLPLPNGCDLLVFPLVGFLGLGLSGALPGEGEADVTFTIPEGLFGFRLTLQDVIFDDGAPGGYAVTNAVEMIVD